MKVYKVIILSIVVVVLISVAVVASKQEASGVENRSFDHSVCQYPNRSTNPPEGCDNSDPCNPQDAAKGGSGACVSVPATTTTITPPAEQPAPVAPVKGCSE